MSSKNPAGAPDDALTPLLDGLAAAAKTAGAQTAGDPKVGMALELGWLTDAIVNGDPCTPRGVVLSRETGFIAQARELTGLLDALALPLAPPPAPALQAAVIAQLALGKPARAQAAAWQPCLLAELFGADRRFVKAYGLGARLNSLGQGRAGDTFTRAGLASVGATLDDLSTSLPSHAGRGVANSLLRWGALDDPATAGASLLPAQCEVWRTLLTGEKKGTEFLEPENYLDAADRLAAKFRGMAVDLLKRHAWLVVLILALFAGGVFVLLTVDPKEVGTTAAGLSGVLAAVGLTWKGVGGTVGQLTGKLEAPLWGAEIDGALTDAITLVEPAATKRRRLMRARRRLSSGDYAGRAAAAKASRPEIPRS